LIAFPAATNIGITRFPGRHYCLVIILLAHGGPSFSCRYGNEYFISRLDLAGSFVGVILSHLCPHAVYIFTLSGFFANYDENYETKHIVLGASKRRTFFNVTLRLVFPGLIVAGLFAFLISWSQYLIINIIDRRREGSHASYASFLSGIRWESVNHRRVIFVVYRSSCLGYRINSAPSQPTRKRD
jgi:putative spermidine/putrescine transport system permease protein